MDFSFTEKKELFRKSVRTFCEKKIAPKANEIDEKGEIPRSPGKIWHLLAFSA